ncbi:MAG: trypsin-like serine protease [Chloroflexota bacterium]
MLKRLRLLVATTATMVALTGVLAGPVAAVTDGALDGGDHPFVGLMLAQDSNGNPLWRCSGTLVNETLFVTAGHCTEAPAAKAVLYFETGPIVTDTHYLSVASGGTGCANADVTGYPCRGGATGSVYTHPQYDPDAFFLFDLGVVVADSPIAMAEYGQLPTLNQLDSLKPRRSTTFTSVGYGLQKSFPDAAGWKDEAIKVRMVAHPHLLQINTGFTGDASLLLSNNANTGGTCFGDSGGPNFVGTSNVMAGVTSFGLNPTCGGTGGVYRIDRSDDLDWLATFQD